MDDDFEYNNENEADMGQLHAIHVHLNAVAAVRRSILTGPSREDCVDCGELIPEPRRIAVAGCLRCITCQGILEHNK